MRRWCSVFATALFFCVLALTWATPAPAQTGTTLPADVADRIDQMAKDQIHAGRTPGLAIGIVEDGRIVYARGFGFADLEKHVPMTPDTEFYVGGLTRQFTAASVLLLAQNGKLTLDDRVTKHLPDFSIGGNVAVSGLLTQTSGLPQYAQIPGLPADPTRAIKQSELFAWFDQFKSPITPGTYANNPVNYLLAGMIVERASGVPLSDYLEQNVFIPLIMDHTFLAGDSGISPERAVGYTRNGRGFAPAPTWAPSWLGGNAGLVTTVYDLAKWDIEMPILLRVDAVRTMFGPSASNGPTHYGMGWVIDRRGGKDFVWSNGEISGYRAMSALLPEQHVGVIVFSNADSFNGSVTVPEQLGARILDAIVPPTAARLDNSVVARAKEWLARLASRHLERDELSPAFNAYLTDDLVAREDFAALGPLVSIVPLSSTAEANGDTLYEFLVSYRRARYHYEFEVTAQGKIDGLTLTA
jgi:CubicO group peptidase (beta-lactamase class C family)